MLRSAAPAFNPFKEQALPFGPLLHRAEDTELPGNGALQAGRTQIWEISVGEAQGTEVGIHFLQEF